MKRTDSNRQWGPAALDALIEEITTDAYGEGEQLWAFRQALEDNVRRPCTALMAGATIAILEFLFDGNERRGLTARCRATDGSKHIVNIADLEVPPATPGAEYLAAYRKWIGYVPTKSPRRARRPHSAAIRSELVSTVELAVLSVARKTAVCRQLETGVSVTVRASGIESAVPGEIVIVKPDRLWNSAGRHNLSGAIRSTRFDAAALRLEPLKLREFGTWDPRKHYWGDVGDPIEKWAKPIIARGNRPEFGMEQILPNDDPEDPFSDPIIESNDRKEAGDRRSASKILMDLCEQDLRCLDAHAHLGNLAFDRSPDQAIRHYESGFRIGELSLGPAFDGVLPWGLLDNRPFLRCMNGFGLCLWRLRKFRDAERILERMLWLNPSDNQGVRLLIGRVRERAAWEEYADL